MDVSGNAIMKSDGGMMGCVGRPVRSGSCLVILRRVAVGIRAEKSISG